MADARGTGPAAAKAAVAARRMWFLFEPIHSVASYFTPESRHAFEDAGLRGFWRGYFAGRAAPLGVTGAATVIAAFYGFAPGMVGRAIPGVWDLITPARALAVRQAGAVAAIRSLLGLAQSDDIAPAVSAAAELLTAVARSLDGAGRPLAAPNLALPVPDEPVARLWHAATMLREHRGDGHIAALVVADVGGAESLALRVGVDLARTVSADDAAGTQLTPTWGRAQTQPARGWSDTEWDAAVARLADRRLLDAHGVATEAGLALHRQIEDATDHAAARPWAALGAERTAELAAVVTPIARACVAGLPDPNPLGIPAARSLGAAAAAH